jgi:predicted xylose isomerase-like sugar epimerase
MPRERGAARQEGSIWTALALNRHLNPFTIEVDVENASAKITGTVETSVVHDLAEQIALGIDGVNKVDNQLQLDPEFQATVSVSQADGAANIRGVDADALRVDS